VIEPWQTDEQLAAEDLAFKRFHAMRKHATTRAQRQEAWGVTQDILDRRRAKAWRARPLTEFGEALANGEDTKGWTHPGLRSLTIHEVMSYFPGAYSIAPREGAYAEHRFVMDVMTGLFGYEKRLRLSVKHHVGKASLGHCAVWIPELFLWRVYSKSVKQKPYRNERCEWMP
jgi:hypothetical protein